MKKLLIVRAPFGEIFMPQCREILESEYIVDELLSVKSPDYSSVFHKYYHKIFNLFFIHFLKRRDYYTILADKRKNRHYEICLNKIKQNVYDTILVFRGDRVPEFALKQLQKQSKEIINYQFDGMKMCPEIVNKKDFFNTIYSFEKNDIINYPEFQMKFAPNFYFEYKNENKQAESEADFYYLGVGLQERIRTLTEINSLFPEKKKMFIVSHQNPLPEYFTRQTINYIKNLDNVQSSNCLIDIKLEAHDGLSFRFFEALYYQKKLITNNKAVKEYNFYHPDNILIVDYEHLNKEEIERFLNKEYHVIDKEITEYYSLRNWLARVLN
ncbi:MAG: hypothetical protein QM564_10805 [Bergeyella sp.]